MSPKQAFFIRFNQSTTRYFNMSPTFLSDNCFSDNNSSY